MDKTKKLSLLNEELDDASAKYITESIQNWKESVMAQLQEEVERAKADKLEELEEANLRYREELAEEYSDKFTTALAELKESVKADATASVLKNNPELKILEQIKDLVAPLLNEDFRENTYSDTIARLAEENEALKRNQEILEGAQTLTELLSGYSEKTQKLVLSLIKEGNSEEVTEQFYNIMESLQEVFGEEEDDEEETDDKKKDEDEDEDEEDDDNDEDDEDDEEDEDLEESYIYEGYDGEDEEGEIEESVGSMKHLIKHYSKR